MSLTVLIAEDDPAMVQVLRNAVSDVPGVEVAAEAGDGALALKLYERLRPKVVLIDIDLPKKNGIDLAQEIFDINPWTYIVFCTGFGEYREKAFEIYAFDYLVKPFKLDRIAKTLKRIIALESSQIYDPAKESKTVFSKGEPKGARLFKDADRFLKIDYKDIIFITRENRKTVIHYIGGKVYTDETMGALEEQLKDNMFFRAHKGFLININMIKELIPCGKSTYQVIMSHSAERPLMTWDKLRELDGMTKKIIVS